MIAKIIAVLCRCGEMVDAVDSKSTPSNRVLVRVRPSALFFFFLFSPFLLLAPLYASDWPEMMLKKMTVEEKIGQLFVAPTWPQRDSLHKEDLFLLIKKYHVGGIIFLNYGDLLHYRNLMQDLQNISEIPLFFLIDGEWGLGMRISDAPTFPKNLTLGAIQDDYWIYLLGKEIGRQCKVLGFPINLAPVVDVNNNPNNPVIHIRSFGEDPKNVANKARSFTRGLKEAGILTCAKHFPGHGDTATDSHLDLPVLLHTKERFEQVELVPFKEVIDEKIDMVMTGHLVIPSLEPIDSLPVTFSEGIVKGLLKKELKFEGLIISDALNMKALTLYYPREEIGLRALLAGHDILLYGDHIAPHIDRIIHEDIPVSFNKIKEALDKGIITEEFLDKQVLKILNLKEKMITTPKYEMLTTPYTLFLKKELFKRAVTLVENQDHTLPLEPYNSYAFFSPEEGNFCFEQKLCEYARITKVSESDDLTKFAGVIVAVREISDEKIHQIKQIIKKNQNVILVLFTTPYSLSHFPEFKTIVVAYENDPELFEIVAKQLFGKLPFRGTLPISLQSNS